MSRAGWTRKPCDGCGEEGLRKMGSVCTECARLMSDGRTFREQTAASPLVPRRWHRVVHWNPQLYLAGGVNSNHRNDARSRGIDRSFAELVYAIGTPAPESVRVAAPLVARRRSEEEKDRYYYTGSVQGDDRAGTIMLPATVAAALDELWHASHDAIRAAGEAGTKYGADLLRRAADGSIPIEKFNEWSLRGPVAR